MALAKLVNHEVDLVGRIALLRESSNQLPVLYKSSIAGANLNRMALGERHTPSDGKAHASSELPRRNKLQNFRYGDYGK